MSDVQQFNVYLPRELGRRVKHAAVDEGVSLSRLVEQALERHLAALVEEAEREAAADQMRPRRRGRSSLLLRFGVGRRLPEEADAPRDHRVDRARRYRRRACPCTSARSTPQTTPPGQPCRRRPESRVELAFEAKEPLEDVVARLRSAGYEPETALVDDAFGRSFTVRDPEGLLLQVIEHDRDLQA